MSLERIDGVSEGEFSNKTLLVLTPRYPNGDNSYVREMFVKTQLDAIRKYFKKVIILSPVLFSFGRLPEGKFCRDYSYENVEVYYPRCYYIPLLWTGPFVLDNRLAVIDRLIQTHQLTFDLIHAHFTWPSGYIGVQLKEKYGVPLVTTIHENGDWFDREVRMDHPLIKSAWAGADALIRVNKKDMPVLKRYNDRIFSIPNGFSPSFYPMDAQTARERLGLPSEKKVLFSLGFLTKRKGFHHLIDAMDAICEQRTDVVCYIGGSGAEHKSLQAQIARMQHRDTVHLLGSVPNDLLPFWMNACDIFVLSSLNEGNPTVMFEALGCGKPFVGTRVGGVPEVIHADTYGLLVEPGDVHDLAEKIRIALDMEWNTDEILRYARQFTWENIAVETMKTYQKAGIFSEKRS